MALAIWSQYQDVQVWTKSYLTSVAVESGNAKDVGTAALRVGVKASRADRGESAGSEEGNGELHFEGVGVLVGNKDW